MERRIYIRSASMISPQPTFGVQPEADALIVHTGSRMNALEPDYKLLLDKNAIRRMSRIIRMGSAAATQCMLSAGDIKPDAIITGTAYGCLEDTISFLNKMVDQEEDMLTPTAFIQSTHNTIGSQIALSMDCHGYNNTFVHRGLSFEHALWDARMLLEEAEVTNVLVGGIDELTDISHAILQRFGCYTTNGNSAELLQQAGKGTMAGEGAGFFLLTTETSDDHLASLDHLSMRFDPDEEMDVNKWIMETMDEMHIPIGEIDLFLLGRNGDQQNDERYQVLEWALDIGPRTRYFKQFCGEYPTASAFGFWMAVNALKHGKLPLAEGDEMEFGDTSRILVYNFAGYGHHSLMLLSAC